MVVDLAVENDGRIAVVAEDWLVAAGQVDDLQPHGAQRDFAALEDRLLVRSPVVQSFGDSAADTPVRRSGYTCKSRYPAHPRHTRENYLRFPLYGGFC